MTARIPTSLEYRAQMIGDLSTNIAFASNAGARREAVKAEALKHLREVAGIVTGADAEPRAAFYDDEGPL